MGGSSSSSSSSNSREYSNSLNTTVTSAVSGANSVGVLSSGTNTGNDLSYAYDSNNPVYNYTSQDQYAVGAGSSTGGASASGPTSSSSGGGAASGIDWASLIPYIIGGVLLVYVLRFLGDKNA